MAIISDNTTGNPYHSEKDGKFTSANDANSATTETTQSVYQRYLDDKVPFSEWDDNSRNHFIDDKIVMPYFEKNIIPQIMETYGFIDWDSTVGTEFDKKGIDYIFVDEDGGLIKIDLKNVSSSFGGEDNFDNANVSFRLKQTIFKNGEMKLVDGYMLNDKHLDDKIFVQCLNTDGRLDEMGEKLLNGEQPQINGHTVFSIDSQDLKNTIYNNFYGKDGLNALVSNNLKSLMNNTEFFSNSGYQTTTKNGKTTHIEIPIPKIGNIVSTGAKFVYDIKYDKDGNPSRFTCNLVMPKNLASSKYIFKTAKKY